MTTFLVCRWEPNSIAALLDRGLELIVLFDEWEAANRTFDSDLLGRISRTITVASFDAMDHLSMVASGLLEEGTVIDQVVVVDERGLLGAGYLAAALGVPGPSVLQSVRVRDKRAMKLAAASAGVRIAKFATLPADVPEAVSAAQDRVGFPCVVKPVAGMGTTATARIDSSAELSTWLDANAESAPFMVEEFISGREYHVDAVWKEGRIIEIAVCRYMKPRIEIDNPNILNGAILIRRDLDQELYEQVEQMHDALAGPFEFSTGITHAEFFEIAPGELVFSEIALRCGGAGAMNIHRPRGADMREVWAAAMAGDPADALPVLEDSTDQHLAWLLLAPTAAGTVVRIPTDEEIASYPYILDVERLAKVGDTVRLHSLTAGMTTVISGADEDELHTRALELADSLTFEVEVGEDAHA
ncbi:ATP-grasp domain-containing protein [Microbacterium sp. SSW1-49]|uniref:ATP-grasp domain-containing protein n=1 Tax=Microbacterium croceum TaxID=2851645 RepID=A0ABT0FG51_9MICO|nr:ATP-grasp domain-containing protein [Microbacterium croceum]MCK2037023.1 ATP-grasp domain-containing protein [Microbacterium croceum]